MRFNFNTDASDGKSASEFSLQHPSVKLRDWRRFISWRYDSENKVPVDPRTGRNVDCGNRAAQMSYEQARQAKLRVKRAAGIGFVLDDTPFCLVDTDNCFVAGPEGTELTEFASGVLRELGGVEEVSVSGEGMHSLVQGEKPGSECSRKERGREIEVYDHARFVAIADEQIVDRPIHERQAELEALYWRTWPQMSLEEPTEHKEWSESAGEGLAADAEVLDKGRAARDTGQAFRTLYDKGETGGYRTRSEAHFALCKMLAFWTGGDEEQVERLFRESALAVTVERSNPESYVRRTVRKACKRQTKHYEPGAGDALKARVRDMAQGHLGWIEEQDWSNKTDRRVYEAVTRHAGEWAYLADDGALEFDVNQQSIADAVGVSQRMVSKSLHRLREAGLITRISKGHTDKNNYYKFRSELHSRAIPYSQAGPLRSTVFPPV